MYIYDLVEPRRLLNFIRNLAFPRFETLRRFLPPVQVADLEFRYYKGALADQDAAQFRAFDTPAGIAKRPGVTRVSGELAPISRKVKLGEEDRLRLQQMLSAPGVADPRVPSIFNDAANMARAVVARVAIEQGRALYDGKVKIEENGLVQEADFGIPAGHRVTAGTVWSNAASDPITDIANWSQIWTDTNGNRPGLALTSSKVVNDLLKNTIVRNMGGAETGQPFVRRATLDQLLIDFALPPIVVDDTTVRVNGVATRVIPEDRFLLLPDPAEEPFGRTEYGVTAEALELVDARQIRMEEAPGITAVIDKEFDPVGTWTKASAVVMPIVGNGELILTADVR